jgi:hypothetical protein
MAKDNNDKKQQNAYSARTIERGIQQKAMNILRTTLNYEKNFNPDKPHTAQEYSQYGINPFLNHTFAYILTHTTVPVCQAGSRQGFDVTFTFGDRLLTQILMMPVELEKAYEVALKYGPGINNKNFGINYVQKDPKVIDNLVREYGPEIMHDLKVSSAGNLSLAKISWHNPSGKYFVGVANNAPVSTEESSKRRMIFLDVRQ